MSVWKWLFGTSRPSISYRIENYRYIVVGSRTVSKGFYDREDAEAHRLLCYISRPEWGPYHIGYGDTGGK